MAGPSSFLREQQGGAARHKKGAPQACGAPQRRYLIWISACFPTGTPGDPGTLSKGSAPVRTPESARGVSRRLAEREPPDCAYRESPTVWPVLLLDALHALRKPDVLRCGGFSLLRTVRGPLAKVLLCASRVLPRRPSQDHHGHRLGRRQRAHRWRMGGDPGRGHFVSDAAGLSSMSLCSAWRTSPKRRTRSRAVTAPCRDCGMDTFPRGGGGLHGPQ